MIIGIMCVKNFLIFLFVLTILVRYIRKVFHPEVQIDVYALFYKGRKNKRGGVALCLGNSNIKINIMKSI